MPSEEVPGIAESWRIFMSHVQPRRLFQEDPGVKGPLWFGRKPTSPFHVLANVLRLFIAIVFNPIYIFIPHTARSFESDFIKRLLWSIEWAKTPDAILLESPGSLVSDKGKIRVAHSGEYAVTGYKPRWLLEVEFRGTRIVSQRQVRYERTGEEGDDLTPESSPDDSLRKKIAGLKYTAISYYMGSAEELFRESGRRLDPPPGIQPDGKKYSLGNRREIARALLDEYARARKTVNTKPDGVEYIWLDEFCLSDDELQDEQQIRKQREAEVGQLADIFRGARHVVVFCHVERCDHTGTACPWANRLFTMGEILYTPRVLQMTRSRKFGDPRLSSDITVKDGPEFRSDMQARAAKDKRWHLYNIIQHATNSGAVSWQSAIHSLVVEAIRRDEVTDFHKHGFLGKALNGLLPRRSQREDLRGNNGWADLAWLLELNQGYYNAALLAAVCKLADDHVEAYRFWGKPIPKEGTERLEALVHAIPVTFRETADRPPELILSLVGPKSVTLSHWLQRDSAGLYRNPEMRSLKQWAIGIYIVLLIIFIIIIPSGSPCVGGVLIYVATLAFTVLELLVGTMFVEKDVWVVIEDHTTIGRDTYRWLQSQDPTFEKAVEWGARQLIPESDIPQASPSPQAFRPALTLSLSSTFGLAC